MISFFLTSVCSWRVSEPLNHTINDDGSVSVTCMCDNEKNELEAKLKMNNEYVCELYDKSQAQTETKCNWHNEGNKFVFTLMKPEAFLKNTFTCVISKIKPLPIETKEGPSIKLLRGKFTPCEQHSTSVNQFCIPRKAFKGCGISCFFFFLSITYIQIIF